MTSARKSNLLASLRTTIPQIFNDAQKPNANHRKYSIALRKLQVQLCLNSPIDKDKSHDIDYEGEEAFDKEFFRNVNKILTVKKREPHADRIVRFIAAFLQYTQQQDNESKEPKEIVNDGDDMEGEETVSSRFVEHLMRHLIKGLMAKNKTVRLRSCQVVALSVNSLGEIEYVKQKTKKKNQYYHYLYLEKKNEIHVFLYKKKIHVCR
ncbi:hypothetical protein J3Q64DRAFT_1078725 [Phycomyces blakesleeanus]|uniref:Uncharacterized protein n=1 Tax=Phycomyces blakesleeanus TaxID=4837 RepID=A0ABR3BJ30_PHYBL